MSDVTDHEDKSTRETSMVAIEERLAKLPTRDLRALEKRHHETSRQVRTNLVMMIMFLIPNVCFVSGLIAAISSANPSVTATAMGFLFVFGLGARFYYKQTNKSQKELESVGEDLRFLREQREATAGEISLVSEYAEGGELSMTNDSAGALTRAGEREVQGPET